MILEKAQHTKKYRKRQKKLPFFVKKKQFKRKSKKTVDKGFNYMINYQLPLKKTFVLAISKNIVKNNILLLTLCRIFDILQLHFKKRVHLDL